MSRRASLGVLAAAVVVLVLGIVAAATYDDGSKGRTDAGRSITTVPPTTRASSASTTTTTANSGASTSTTTTPSSSPTTTSGAPSTSALATATTLRGIPGTTAPTASTVRPSVGSPEAAANGLIAAYRNGDRTQAERFATSGVVEVLFEKAYEPADDPGFQGCRPDGGDFLCTYLQPTVRYDMTAQGDAAGEFRIIAIDVQDT